MRSRPPSAFRWHWSTAPPAPCANASRPARTRACSPRPISTTPPGWWHPAGAIGSGPSPATACASSPNKKIGGGVDDALDLLLDPRLRLGVSTPGADPSGDYALDLFRAADRVTPGAGCTLAAKAMRLTGGPHLATAPAGRNLYAWVLALNRADLFLTYRTNALAAQRENPGLRLIELPSELAVEAEYGLTVHDRRAWPLARFVLLDAGRTILARYGFLPPAPLSDLRAT